MAQKSLFKARFLVFRAVYAVHWTITNSSLWSSGSKAGNEFTQYKNSTLIAANQLITNSEKQSVLIGDFGFRSRKLLGNL